LAVVFFFMRPIPQSHARINKERAMELSPIFGDGLIGQAATVMG
jgi:hypothetical protein